MSFIGAKNMIYAITPVETNMINNASTTTSAGILDCCKYGTRESHTSATKRVYKTTISACARPVQNAFRYVFV
jgi:hypothetical protein